MTWSGNQATCTDARTKKVCSGHDVCLCGECQCPSGFSGKYCQKNENEPLCQKLGPCIQDKLLQKITKDTSAKIKQMSSKLRNSCVENRQLHKFGYNIHKLCYRSKAESASGLDLKSSCLE